MKKNIKTIVLIIGLVFINTIYIKGASIHNQLNQQVFRVRVNLTQAVELTIQLNLLDGSVIISGEYVNITSSDFFASYLLDGSYLQADKSVALPNNNSNFWRIYFDYENESNPVLYYKPNGGGSIKIECQCVKGIMGNTACEEAGTCDTSGDLGGCVTCCSTGCNCECQAKEIKGGMLILEATSLYFNGVEYQQM